MDLLVCYLNKLQNARCNDKDKKNLSAWTCRPEIFSVNKVTGYVPDGRSSVHGRHQDFFLCRSVAGLLEFHPRLMLRTQHYVFGNWACCCSHMKKWGDTCLVLSFRIVGLRKSVWWNVYKQLGLAFTNMKY